LKQRQRRMLTVSCSIGAMTRIGIPPGSNARLTRCFHSLEAFLLDNRFHEIIPPIAGPIYHVFLVRFCRPGLSNRLDPSRFQQFWSDHACSFLGGVSVHAGAWARVLVEWQRRCRLEAPY